MNRNSSHLPPHLVMGDKVILFDGVCKLCNAWSKFIIRYDKQHQFKLASVQSPEGQDILNYFGYPIDTYKTMLVVNCTDFFDKGDAFFYVMKNLGFPWKLILIFRLFPKVLRDWAYDRIALNRYKLFGQYKSCVLPNADHSERYLDGS